MWDLGLPDPSPATHPRALSPCQAAVPHQEGPWELPWHHPISKQNEKSPGCSSVRIQPCPHREGDGGGQKHPKGTGTSRGNPWSSRDVTHGTGHALGLLQEEMNMDL